MEDYKSIDSITKSEDFLSKFLAGAKSTASHIRKVELSDDLLLMYSQSKEYERETNRTKSKIERIMTKLMTCTDPTQATFRKIDFENFRQVVSHVDSALDRLSLNLDIVKGIRKDKRQEDIEKELEIIRKAQVQFTARRHKGPAVSANSGQTGLKLKPEVSEEFDIDNSYFPFIPRIEDKPHKLVDLDPSIKEAREHRLAHKEKYKKIDFYDYKTPEFVFPHAYRQEIETCFERLSQKIGSLNRIYARNSLSAEISDLLTSGVAYTDYDLFTKENAFASELLTVRDWGSDRRDRQGGLDRFTVLDLKNISTKRVFSYNTLEGTSFEYIDELPALERMISELKAAQEIAIDLEAHQLESYQGLTCLMQLSTRVKDYIVDCIRLRQKMKLLNEVFCDPAIVKVLHGADYDVLWLQRDFGVFIVNMFDTGQAASILSYPFKSLAYLLQKFCNVTADKKYQLADWRVRPLPAEMIKYAREDTHYLLYIYDAMKYELLLKSIHRRENLLEALLLTLQRSNNLTAQSYVKPSARSMQYYNLVQRSGSMTKNQISMFKTVLKFRDYLARVLDKSVNLVLSNDCCRSIAKMEGFEVLGLRAVLAKFNASNAVMNFIDEFSEVLESRLNRIKEEAEHTAYGADDREAYIRKYKEKVSLNLSSRRVATEGKTFAGLDLTEKSSSVLRVFDYKKFVPLVELDGIQARESRLFKDREGVPSSRDAEYDRIVESFKQFDIFKHLMPRAKELKLKVAAKEKKAEVKREKAPLEVEDKLLSKKRPGGVESRQEVIDLTRVQGDSNSEESSFDEEQLVKPSNPSILARANYMSSMLSAKPKGKNKSKGKAN